MSVVSLVFCDDFALLMGDTKLSNDSHGNTITKVFEKEKILLGFTGNIIEIGTFLYPIFDEHMQINDNYTWGEPEDFFLSLDYRFYKIIETNMEKDIIFVAAAKMGNKYVTKYYCLLNSNGYSWRTETSISNNKISYYYLGQNIHKNFFKQKIKENTAVTIEDITSIFQSTLDYGTQYDDTINNRMEWLHI